MGGQCNIIVNDDGIFKILDDRMNNLGGYEEVNNRIRYNISFTGRPGVFKNNQNDVTWMLNQLLSKTFSDVYKKVVFEQIFQNN